MNHLQNAAQAEAEESAQKMLRKNEVLPLLRTVNDATAPRDIADVSPFDSSNLLTRLDDYEKRAAAVRREAEGIYEFLSDKQGTEQPESTCKQWATQLARLQRCLAQLAALQAEAQEVYDAKMASWLSAANEAGTIADYSAELKELSQKLEALKKKLTGRRGSVDPDGIAYAGYNMDIKRVNKRQKLIEETLAEWNQTTKAAVEARAMVVTDAGEINKNGEPIVKADALMASILTAPACSVEGLVAPTILPAPPPPPFVPDFRIVTTGDLSDSLLEPLVNQWLKSHKATPLEGEGKSFTWNVKDEHTREIEVKVPSDFPGVTDGVLRIRMTTEPNGSTVFTHLLNGGDADLVLTGRKMSKQMESLWLPKGQTLETLDPQGKGRAYRTRVCSDALIFFRGDALAVEAVSAGVLQTTPKVFASDDAGRMEASSLFSLLPDATDRRVMAADKSAATVTQEYPEQLFMGTWHQDGLNHNPGRALAVSSQTALGYSTCWDDEAVLKNIPSEYRAVGAGCVPTDDTINSGQYAFSYNITFYRSVQADGKAAAAAADLMAYASDVKNKEVEALVRVRGFAPLQFELSRPNNTLSDKDLPLALVIRQMEKAGLDMGYDADACTWVYGVRIPIPLYYEVGSATSDGKSSVAIDPDSRYYTEAQGLQAITRMTEGRRACLVLVGHADPQWGKKLDTGKESWKKNLSLSTERANGVYQSLFRDILAGNAQLGNVQLGVSWARPAVDLDRQKSVEEQETALGRCRRVDIFLIFPMTAE